MNVLVIYGGDSSEREVSLKSGRSVGEALVQAGHTVTYFDPISGYDELSKHVATCDVAFPILHGTGGEDGTVQAELDKCAIPYVGSDAIVSASCFDKLQTMQHAKDVVFAPAELVSYESIKQSQLLSAPFVLKPRAEGSSVDTFIIKNPTEFDVTVLQPVFAKHADELLISKYIDGTEITVAVLNGTALPVIEIIPPDGQEFDFTNKYNGATKELCPPKTVSLKLQQQAQNIAEALHTVMGCRHFSRTDMIIDSEGSIYTLEINTLPGMTTQSLFPLAASVAGYTMPQLVDTLVTSAYNDYQSKV